MTRKRSITSRIRAFFRWLGHPFRAVANAFKVLVNLSAQQVKALFSVGMLAGMVSLSFQNMGLTYVAQKAVDKGDTFRIFFDLIQEQMRFNSGLTAWFAIILGLVVFGADYFKARWGDREFETGHKDREDDRSDLDTNAP